MERTLRRWKRQKGMAVVAAAVILLLVIPMIGLAIDVSILFIVKTRLQGAVDGAALSGARSLARGANGAAQISSAQNAASAYVRTNFPNGYFFSSGLNIPTPTVDLSVAFQRSVFVTADVQVPALFERILGFTSNTVRASATSTRKDVNIVIAFDRSGSLSASSSCTPLKQAAVNFVNQFANLRDNLGLITFATSSWVDYALQNNFNPGAINVINNVVCAGSTSTAAALWEAYSQLVTLNQGGALNVLLLFTDGQPTGLAVNMPIKPLGAGATQSPCTKTTAPVAPSVNRTIRGHFGITTDYSSIFGLLNLHTSVQPVSNGDLALANFSGTDNSTSCNYATGWSNNSSLNNTTTLTDFAFLPDTDIYGNSLDNGYNAINRSSGNISITNTNMQNATLNAADSAAARIRAGATDPVNGRGMTGITIYAIGLGNAAIPASPTFLRRVSNDPASPIYDSTKPAGMYVYAANTSDLNTAFQRIASEVLRLSR